MGFENSSIIRLSMILVGTPVRGAVSSLSVARRSAPATDKLDQDSRTDDETRTRLEESEPSSTDCTNVSGFVRAMLSVSSQSRIGHIHLGRAVHQSSVEQARLLCLTLWRTSPATQGPIAIVDPRKEKTLTN